MTCNNMLVGALEVEAHVINGATYARARALAEACGSLVYWDQKEGRAAVVPALPPAWETLHPLVDANRRWSQRYPENAMFQARFNHLWAEGLRVMVDPRLLIAILIQEGTGSFNTNAANAGDYNGNGPDADWIRDTAKAVALVRGKLAWYRQAVAAGFRQAAATLGLDGSAVQFINWPGPIGETNTYSGCYAQHADWWTGVSAYYERLGGAVALLSDFWAAEWPWNKAGAIELRCEAVTNRPDLCSDLSGNVGRPGVVTQVR